MSELPEGWSSAAVTALARFVRGVTYTKTDVQESHASGLIGIIRANNIGEFRFDLSDLVYVPERLVSPEQKLQIGDVVIATSSGSISVVGKAAPVLAAMSASFGAFCGVLRPLPDMEPRYFGRYFQSEEYRRAASAAARGVNINNLKRSHFDSFHIAFPGQSAQRRIADKLDALLSKAETCRERLARVPQILKKFREAVLEAAVSGRLTEEWRAEQPSPVSPWISAVVGDLLVDLRYGTAVKCSYDQTQDTPVLRIPNVAAGKIDVSDLKYGKLSKDDERRLSLQQGDLLLVRSNGSIDLVGHVAVVPEGFHRYSFAGYLIRLRPNLERVIPSYLGLVFSSPKVRAHVELTARSTSGVNNLNSDEVRAITVPLPSLPEQEEIVRRTEEVLTRANSVERRHTDAAAQVEKLISSVLAKAFRGELVPQDPNDEPAGEMLERIRAKGSAKIEEGVRVRVKPGKDRISTLAKREGGRRLRASSA